MYHQTLRNAEYHRKLADTMVVVMQSAIKDYRASKTAANIALAPKVEKRVKQLEIDLQTLLEQINDPAHQPSHADEYYAQAIKLSKRKTGSTTLDNGKNGIESLAGQVMNAREKFENDYVAGSELEIECNKSLGLSLTLAMKQVIDEHRAAETIYDLPKIDFSGLLKNDKKTEKKETYTWGKSTKTDADAIETFYNQLILLEDSIRKNVGEHYEPVDRHNYSLTHLEKVETYSHQKLNNPQIEKKLIDAVSQKKIEWEANTSKVRSEQEFMKPQFRPW